MSVKNKLVAVLAIIVPVAVGLVAVVRSLQMRSVLIELYGPGADMQGLARDIFISLIPTVTGVVAAAVIFILIVIRFLNPLEGLVKIARELANGNTAANIKIKGNDEIGKISMSIFEIAKSLNTLRDDFEKAEKTIGEGNVMFRIENDNLNGVFGEILDGFNNVKNEFVEFLEHITEPVIIINSDNKVLYANRIIRQITQTEDKKIEGLFVDDFLNGNVSDHEYTKKTFATGKVHKETMIRLQFNSNQVFDFEYNCIPVKYRSKTAAVMILLTNLTHIKQMQHRNEKRNNFHVEQFSKLTKILTEAFSKGHLDMSIPKITDYDEDTADIAEEFNAVSGVLGSSISFVGAYIQEIQKTLHSMSNKDFSRKIVREHAGDFGKIEDSIEVILSNMNQFFHELSGSALQVQMGANAIANASQEASASFNEQLEFVSEVNEQVYNINEEISESLQNAQIAANLSSMAKSDAQGGNSHMADMLAAMDDIRISTDTIAGIIKTIQDVAFQTNLLALNASVEAARAGEHGKGFSVVAEAVRTLAIKAASAAEESGDIILASKDKVNTGVKIAQETADSLNKIVSGVENIDLIIEKIAASSTRQSSAIGNIKEGTAKINDMIK
ncbi:MAG: methyl-accepting chemotaxis protein, partial [Prevotellaceae bacterium]|nr:methyl-accepting chemotaxis protein [Prevotellaceae bacterium]